MSDKQEFRYSKSYLTGQWYKVTDWEEVGDPENGTQKIIANQKEPIDKEEVPQEAIESLSKQNVGEETENT